MKLKAFVYYIAVFIISTLSDYVVELEVVIENGNYLQEILTTN